MTMRQLTQTAQPVWNSKSSAEKLLTKILVGLAAIAAGNSGFQFLAQHFGRDLTSLVTTAGLDMNSAQWTAIERSLLAGGATGLGALALLFMRQMNAGHLTQFITLAAGAMLSAAVFSLGLPAWQSMPEAHGLLLLAAAGGASLMLLLDRVVPHQHQESAAPRVAQASVRTLWLMIAAISLHNLPEGFAVGATAGIGDAQANSTTLAIALQNVPEGLIVATGLWALGVNKFTASIMALLTGMIEPIGAVIGAKVVTAMPAATPLALAFAAGAMLFVVLHEMLPESRKLNSHLQTGGLFAGSMVGMWVMNQLGT
ncbi:MAG: ZIP family metal transporter [Steroidobacteraceae bacterium]